MSHPAPTPGATVSPPGSPGPTEPRPERPQIRLATDLVGRQSESSQIEAFLGRTTGRDGGVLIITGEAGIGKTRLLERAQQLAVAHGIAVLRVACQDHDRGIPYAPWIGLLRKYVADTPREVVYRTVSPHLAALLKLVPELNELVWLHDLGASAPAEWERQHFLAAVAQFFVAMAEDHPVLVALDDVGWADAASLELLETVARVGRGSALALVGAFRDTHLEDNTGLQTLMFSLERERWATTIHVQPLDPEALGQLVGAVLQRTHLGPELLELLYAKTRGNPFFTGELLQSLADEGTIYQTPEGWASKPVAQIRLPTTVAGTIESRLRRLDEEELQVLRLASLLGLEFSFELLDRVAELGQDRALTALEKAQRAHLVKERESDGGKIAYVFTHPLIQEVLEAEVGQTRARILHLRAAQALESSYGVSAKEHAAVLAYHYLRGNDLTRALEFSVEAGDRASAVFARGEAAEHYRTALRLLGTEGTAALRCRVQQALADQERALSDVEVAALQYEEAANGWESLGRRCEAAECLRRAADCWPGSLSDVFRFLERSRRLLDGEPPGRTLVSWYLSSGTTIADQGRPSEGGDQFRSALRLARSLGDTPGEASALLKLAYCVPLERRAEFATLNDEAEKIISKNQLAEAGRELFMGRAIFAYHCQGELQAFIGYIEMAAELGRKSGDVELESYMRGFAIPWVSLRTGDFRPALALVEERRRRHRSLGLSGWAPTVEAMGVRASLTILTGPLDRGEELVAEAIEAERLHPLWRDEGHFQQFLGRLRLAQGRPLDALDALEESRRVYLRGGPPAWHALFFAETLRLLVRALLEVGRVEAAQERAKELGQLAKSFDNAPAWALAWRAEAACKLAHGERSSVFELLEKSREVWNRLGWKYDLASTWYEIGSGRAAGGETEPAREALEEALRQFREIGAQPDVERTLTALGRSE
jgi:tetratricopeptide (TPR) repeat protein